MGINWSDQQLHIIESRDKDLLVSAAAGSGKTAVLVERIIRLITDPDRPVDVDQLLVVTFTKAAAGEMKNRIAKALTERMDQEAAEEHPNASALANLQKQSALVQNAQITTIDSFCLFVVRNYFEEIDLDPDFRVGDEVEMKLLVKDVLDMVMEDNYSRPDNEAFLRMVNLYSDARSDRKFRDLVEEVYKASLSAPWPELWLDSLLDSYQIKNAEEFEQSVIIQNLIVYAKACIEDAIGRAKAFRDLCRETAGFEKYAERADLDIAMLEEGTKAESYDRIAAFLSNLDWGRIPSVDKSLAEQKGRMQDLRNAYKKILTDLAGSYFYLDMATVMEQMAALAPQVEAFVGLAKELYRKMQEEKRRRKVVDFADMEHFALDILVEPHKPGQAQVLRPVAERFRKHYKEVMIDEYQDSNDVQEEILSAVAGENVGEYKMFMVGDVKQSIYKFRMAKPELFMDKYNNRFAYGESDHEKIDLSQNFRSRGGVLDFCNDIFFAIMHADLGGVEYTKEVALHVGDPNAYPESEEPCAELLLLDAESASEDDERKNSEKEAALVAHRILELMSQPCQVFDKDAKAMRPVTYSDIVILCRSIRDYGPVFTKVFEDYNIPVHVDSTTGYFSANEVAVILNFLSLIDNPLQDIPMASVLHSAIVGLDEEELAEIRVNAEDKKTPFALAALNYLQEQEEGPAADFYALLTELRGRKDLSVHELIELIYARTGFDNLMAGLPGGQMRLANLQMLVEMAIKFEETSYKGLFNFLRYIEQMKKYEIDFGEADVGGENGNKVHIKTIHKSKGLEFPIVFVCGMTKHINTMDENGDMLIHSGVGIGLRLLEDKPKRKKNTLVHSAVRNFMHRDTLGEELRVLYVALTRAKEKLILTGVAKQKDRSDQAFNYAMRIGAKSYLDWVLPALDSYGEKYKDTCQFCTTDEIALSEERMQQKQARDCAALHEKIDLADPELVDQICRAFDYEYTYASDISKKAKYAVSDLKHASMVEAYDAKEGEAAPEFVKHEKASVLPKFARALAPKNDDEIDYAQEKTGDGTPAGALYGTAVHRAMEVLDFVGFSKIDMEDQNAVHDFARSEYDRMCRDNLLETELRKRVRPSLIEDFLHSSVAKRMAEAAARGQLYCEKPFVMYLEEEDFLVQGIIDVFWREGDDLILMDYKTDKVKDPEELVMRYQKQLELYKTALEKIFKTEDNKVNVKESLLYSFRFKEVVKI